MFGLGMGEIILVLIIALVFIGPKKLPEVARGLGKGLRDFQNAAKGFQDQITKEVDEAKPQFDAKDFPSVESIKEDIIPSANGSGHANWEPFPDQPKIPDTVTEASPVIPKKDDDSKV